MAVVNQWEVIVQNVGRVFNSLTFEFVARKVFNEYVEKSKNGEGRCAGSTVDLYKDGVPVDEYNVFMEEDADETSRLEVPQ